MTFESGADFSGDEIYRYFLYRMWDRSQPTAMFIMLNPSTAGETEDDPTIRKCIGFAKRWECGGIYVINLFGLRATDPRGLRAFPDIMGPDNVKAQRRALWQLTLDGVTAGPCVVAWGKQPKAVLGDAPMDFAELARIEGVKLQCLGTNQNGSPKHPLMLAYKTPLQPWGPA